MERIVVAMEVGIIMILLIGVVMGIIMWKMWKEWIKPIEEENRDGYKNNK
jgi:hypothetical protein